MPSTLLIVKIQHIIENFNFIFASYETIEKN